VLSKASDPRFGGTLVDVNGTQFEGCDAVDDWTYECDYASRLHVSREHYEAGHWVLRALWSWRKYTVSGWMRSRSLGILGRWAREGVLALLENCLNAPMEWPK